MSGREGGKTTIKRLGLTKSQERILAVVDGDGAKEEGKGQQRGLNRGPKKGSRKLIVERECAQGRFV